MGEEVYNVGYDDFPGRARRLRKQLVKELKAERKKKRELRKYKGRVGWSRTNPGRVSKI